jgi:hypothetical protein
MSRRRTIGPKNWWRRMLRYRRALVTISEEIRISMACNHPQDSGDNKCDGEDCIHCFVIQTVDTALGTAHVTPKAE